MINARCFRDKNAPGCKKRLYAVEISKSDAANLASYIFTPLDFNEDDEFWTDAKGNNFAMINAKCLRRGANCKKLYAVEISKSDAANLAKP